MNPFVPPNFNLPLAWTVDFTLPILMKTAYNIDGVIIGDHEKSVLRSLRNERMIYSSNHPTNTDPAVAYAVAQTMGSRFYFLAARQIFDWGNGMIGRLIQGLGAYSVLAGIPDRESIRRTRDILTSPAGKVLIFPEGEPLSGENDSLLPFQMGLAQLAFWAYEDLHKHEPGSDISILPSFVKYVYNGTDAGIKADLHTALKRLEKKLQINPENKNILRRFLTVSRILLERTEKEHGIVPGADEDYDYRIGRIRHFVLDRLADKLQLIGYKKDTDAISKLRYLLATLEMIEIKYPDPRLPTLTKAELEHAQKECQKGYDFIVIKPTYLLSHPSPERFYEWLYRLEKLTFGSTRLRSRKAHVLTGQPFKVSEYYSAYRKNKKGTIDKVTARLRQDTKELAKKGLELSEPLIQPYDTGKLKSH